MTGKREPTEADLLYAVVTVGREEGEHWHSRCVAICRSDSSARFIVEQNASFLAEDEHYQHAVIESFVADAVYGYLGHEGTREWFELEGDCAVACDVPDQYSRIFGWWG